MHGQGAIMTDTPASGSSRTVGAGSVLLTLGGLACCLWRGVVLRAAISLGHGGLRHGLADRVRPAGSAAQVDSADFGAVGLAGGAVLFWRQQQIAASAPGAFCTRPAVRNLTLAGLLVGLVLLYIGYACA
jgi:mercuric ion transport protein